MNLRSTNNFYLWCSGHLINEVRICYNLSEPGKEKETHCYLKDLES